jgi:hypothetical protein
MQPSRSNIDLTSLTLRSGWPLKTRRDRMQEVAWVSLLRCQLGKAAQTTLRPGAASVNRESHLRREHCFGFPARTRAGSARKPHVPALRASGVLANPQSHPPNRHRSDRSGRCDLPPVTTGSGRCSWGSHFSLVCGSTRRMPPSAGSGPSSAFPSMGRGDAGSESGRGWRRRDRLARC